ncbi:MAG: light-harvesting protein [Chloroflexales bacterium]|nr:light-harvesting protein [Chloroflexales bacterium]
MRTPPFEFRTAAILYTLLGIVMALVIHFIVLSSPRLNWLQAPVNNAPAQIIQLLPVWLF